MINDEKIAQVIDNKGVMETDDGVVNCTNSVINQSKITQIVKNSPFIDESFEKQFAIVHRDKSLGQINTECDDFGVVSSLESKVRTQVIVDTQPYWKSYHSAFAIQAKLSHNALRLYLYIAQYLKPTDDKVDLSDLKPIMDAFNWKSPTMFYRGLKELIELGVVAKSGIVGSYWVNLKLFFNGSRIKKTKTFIKELEPKYVNGVKITRYERVTESIEIEEDNSNSARPC